MKKNELKLMSSHIECLIPEEKPVFKCIERKSESGEADYSLVVILKDEKGFEMPDLIENQLLKKQIEEKIAYVRREKCVSEKPYQDIKSQLLMMPVTQESKDAGALEFADDDTKVKAFVIYIKDEDDDEKKIYVTSNDLDAWCIATQIVFEDVIKKYEHTFTENLLLSKSVSDKYTLCRKEYSSLLLLNSKALRKKLYDTLGEYILMPYHISESFIVPTKSITTVKNFVKLMNLIPEVFGEEVYSHTSFYVSENQIKEIRSDFQSSEDTTHEKSKSDLQ